MEIAVVSIGSFDTQYSDYHIMRHMFKAIRRVMDELRYMLGKQNM